MRKTTQDNNKLGHRPSLAVVVVILTCVGCFLQVQWTLYTHRVQIDGLVKHIMKQHQPQSSGKEQVFLQRVQRSQNTQQFPGKNTKSTPNSQINTELIRNEISKQLQHLLKTRICANNNKMCIRGRRGRRGRTGYQGRRGPPGRMGHRGPVGKHGPVGSPCKKCNITVNSLKSLIDTLGPQGLPGLRGPPGPTGEKGEPGKVVSAASISIPPKSVVVNESDMVSLYCGAKGLPTPKVTWHKVNSSSPLSGPRHVVDVNGGLLIRNVNKSDQGTYKCTAKNIFPGEATAYATVAVQDAAKILQNQLVPIITEEKQNVTLTCAASGTPTPTITWSKVLSDGRYDIPQLLSDDRYEISQQIVKNKEDGMMWKDVLSSNLTLINLSLNDNGLYICKADNKLNSDTAMTQLTVVKPLYFTVIPPVKLEVVLGETVQIDCKAINAVGQTWVQPTQDATNVNVFSNGSLVITMTTKRNEGIYKCIARSQYRQISAVTYVSAIGDYGGLEKSAILSNHDDKRYFQDLLSYLAPVLRSSNTSQWKRCWHAATEGWDVTTNFHGQCDGKGPTVTIVRVGKYVFGGYTDVSWHTNQYSRSTRSFLFTLYNTNGYQPIKLSLTGRHNGNAIHGVSDSGPSFGGGNDLHISNQASSNKKSYTYTHTYQPAPGCSSSGYCSFLAGSSKFTPNDVEVFYETT